MSMFCTKKTKYAKKKLWMKSRLKMKSAWLVHFAARAGVELEIKVVLLVSNAAIASCCYKLTLLLFIHRWRTERNL